jgi:hypothetical protein
MQDSTVNTFGGGLDFDSDPRTIKTDRYVDALNVETMSVEKNGINSISPMKSSALAFSIPDVTEQVQYTKLRYQAAVDISFYFYNEAGTLVGQGIINSATNTDFAAFEAAFTSIMAGYSYDVGDFELSDYGEYFIFSIEFAGNVTRTSFLWEVNNIFYDEVVVQEAFTNGKLSPIATWNVEDRLFVFSTTGNSNAIEIGIATKNVTWSYVRILRTWRFALPTTEAIDIRVEKVSNQSWAVYWTDNTNKPKVLYIPEVYTQDCVIKYTLSSWETPTSGYIIYNEVGEQTDLQLINNAGLVTYSNQLQAGGSLPSGGYRYSVRFGLNEIENVTEWSVLTPNVIPVFKASTETPSGYIRIQGEKSGTVTSKANVLLIQNALPNIFNFVELACVYNAGGVNSAYIVGRFNITENEFTITHTGAETGTIAFDTDLLPQTEPVILKAKSLEIKKNRLNLANLEVGADDPALAAIASAVTIGQAKYAMNGVGALSSAADAATVVRGDVSSNGVPWNPNSTSTQTNSGVLKFLDVSDPFNAYDESTGFWTAPTSDNYRMYCRAYFTGRVERTRIEFDTGVILGNPFSITEGNFNWSLFVNGVVVANGTIPNNVVEFDVTFAASAGNVVAIGISYDFSLTSRFLMGTDSSFTITPTGTSSDFVSTKVGEYQLPENCATKVGYMLSEKYAMFLRFHYKNGYISSPFFAGYFDNQWNGTDISLFTSSTSTSTYETYSYFARISGLNVSSIKDKINGVSVWRAECNATVLGTGVVMPADEFSGSKYNTGFYASIPNANGAYGALYNSSADRRFFSMFFSHDTRVNQTQPSAGDTLRFFDCPKILNNVSGLVGVTAGQRGSFAEYYGEIFSSNKGDAEITDGRYTPFIDAIGDINSETAPLRSGSLRYRPNINIRNSASGSMENISLACGDRIAPATSASDNGIYMAQYIKSAVGEQYDLLSVKIIPTGTYINTNELATGICPTLDVFGGDTYTQKNILKVRYWSNINNTGVRCSFVTYYGQQKINTQLFYNNYEADKTTYNLFGHESIINYLFPFTTIEDVVEEQFNYDRGFSANYPLTITGYDPNLPSDFKFISRIYYSQQKPINSLQDFYRKIGAFDFRDLDTKNGIIAAIRDVNNYMVAIQPRAVSVLPYLSDVAIGTQGGGQILVGTGGVYNQRENIISTYGTALQTCTLVGNNNNGNSTLYWFSPEFKKYCRYGGDGVRILSDENSMRSFFLTMNAENEYDMIQTFDVEYASVIMTWGLDSKTLLFNERTNNFTTFTTFQPLRYFFYQNMTLAPKPSIVDFNQVYELFGGTGVLDYLGAGASVFRMEFVVNKEGMSSKRFLSTGLSVGEGYAFVDPTVSMSVNGDTVFPFTVTLFQKRFDNWFGAFNKSNGKQPIGQYAVIRIQSSVYIAILGAVTKFRTVFRSLFK